MRKKLATETEAKKLGARIRSARGRLSRESVADEMKRNPQTIYRWEHGRTVASNDEIAKLAAVLGVSYAWLLCGEGPRKKRSVA